MKKTISLCLLMISLTSFSQKVKISENTNTLINEDFNNKKSVFPIITTIDNYFIIDGGDYLISRNNSETEYAILSSVNDLIHDFHLRTSIKLGPSNNKRSSAGVILKAQTNGKNAIVFEINKKGEFRIKELIDNSSYKYHSGKSINEGWVKSKLIKGEDEYNAIDIKCVDNIFDIYVNNNFLTTLFSPKLRDGRMGIIISQDAKARIAYYRLDVPEKESNNLIDEYEDYNSKLELSNRIKELESLNKVINRNNQKLSNEINNLKNETEKEINILKDNVNLTNDSLSLIIKDLTQENTSSKIQLKDLNKSLQDKREDLLNRLELYTTLENSKNKSDKELKNIKAELKNIKDKLDINNNSLDKVYKEKEDTDKELIDKSKQLESKRIKIGELENKIDNLLRQIEKINNKLEKSESMKIEKDEAIESLMDDKLNLIEEKKVNKQEYQSKIDDLLESLDKEIESSSINNKEISSLNNKIKSLEEKIQTIQNKNLDIQKLQKINKETLSLIDQKEETITSLINKIDGLTQSLRSIEEEKSNVIKFSEEKSSHIQVLSNEIEDLNQEIRNMEEVLIYRGFAEKNIDSKNIETIKTNKTTKTTKTDKEAKGNEIYTVQIATYGSKINISERFKGLDNVFFKKMTDKTFSYMSGKFKNTNDAFEHKNKLISMGYKNAFIITISE